MELFECSWHRPSFDCRNLGMISSNLTFRYNIAKVLNLGHAKFRFCKLDLKLRVFKTLEDPGEVLQKLF